MFHTGDMVDTVMLRMPTVTPMASRNCITAEAVSGCVDSSLNSVVKTGEAATATTSSAAASQDAKRRGVAEDGIATGAGILYVVAC